MNAIPKTTRKSGRKSSLNANRTALPLTGRPRIELPPFRPRNVKDVAGTFLELTEFTVPYRHEGKRFSEYLSDHGWTLDRFGNWWLGIGSEAEQQTMFTAHLDDVSWEVHRVIHQFVEHQGHEWVGSSGDTILGADDKAGMTVLLYMAAHRVPGTYALFVGEEKGCVGSSDAAGEVLLGAFRHCVSFDRPGDSEIITHQVWQRTCSDEFAEALSWAMKAQGVMLEPSDRGVYTDSNSFEGVIPECTNIAVGYTGQHGKHEVQDLTYLAALAEACVQIDWQALPSTRDPQAVDFASGWGRGRSRSYGSNWGDWDDTPDTDEQVLGKGSGPRGLPTLYELLAEKAAGKTVGLNRVAAWTRQHPHSVSTLLYDLINEDPSLLEYALDQLRTRHQGMTSIGVPK